MAHHDLQLSVICTAAIHFGTFRQSEHFNDDIKTKQHDLLLLKYFLHSAAIFSELTWQSYSLTTYLRLL